MPTTEQAPTAPTSDAATETAADSEAMLTPVEARILGSLMEKRYTTPDNYPLTLNALVQACNQKSSRNPVMQLTPGETGNAVNRLRDRKLLDAEFTGRTERYQERLSHQLMLDRKLHAVLCALLLRGPLTLGEIRINASRMVPFDDLGAVTESIERLLAKTPALVQRLQRLPGKREERFGQTLCGPIGEQQAIDSEHQHNTAKPQAHRIAALETEVAALRAELAQLWQLTGLAGQRQPPATD